MSTSAIVEHHLAEFIAGAESELQSVAAEHQALPVYSDMGGTLFITPSLEVLVLGHHSDLAPIPEQSEQWRLIAFASAAGKFPDLQCLLPAPPDNAPQCSACTGRGWVVMPSMRCGECCGLGWLALPLTKPPLE